MSMTISLAISLSQRNEILAAYDSHIKAFRREFKSTEHVLEVLTGYSLYDNHGIAVDPTHPERTARLIAMGD